MIAWLLKRPYSIASLLVLIVLLGIGAALRMPIDIFPAINVPVVSVVWTYSGMTPSEIQNRILTLHERQMPALVDDIDHIEANSYQGVGVIKVYLHENADVTRAVAQVASSALIVLKYMPRNITPPMVLRYGATDVPILQLSLSSKSLTDTRLNDLGQNVIRPALGGGARRVAATAVWRQTSRRHGRHGPTSHGCAGPAAQRHQRRVAE